MNQIPEDLNTKDLHLEAYSRQENIKFHHIAETPSPRNGVEDTEEVLRSSLERHLGYIEAKSVERHREHRLGKRRNRLGAAMPILGEIPLIVNRSFH